MKKATDQDDPADWLRARGEERDRAVQNAAALILQKYRHNLQTQGQPINLYRVAALAGIKIIFIKGLPGGGRLLPVTGGFQILISTGLPSPRFRASVAHELAHSLFYSRSTHVPQRLFPPTKTEHTFCFDVSRHVLAPQWLLDEVKVLSAPDVGAMFDILTRQLRISRPLAARLILTDYKLKLGIAGRWVYEAGVWHLDKPTFVVSPAISGRRKREIDIRHWLRDIAMRTLKGDSSVPDVEVIYIPEKDSQAAFVLVTNQRHLEVALSQDIQPVGW